MAGMTTAVPEGLYCPTCERLAVPGRFDASFRDEDGDPKGPERNIFGIPGALCTNCRQLYIDKDLIDLLNLRYYRCTFAIESDQRLIKGTA